MEICNRRWRLMNCCEETFCLSPQFTEKEASLPFFSGSHRRITRRKERNQIVNRSETISFHAKQHRRLKWLSQGSSSKIELNLLLSQTSAKVQVTQGFLGYSHVMSEQFSFPKTFFFGSRNRYHMALVGNRRRLKVLGWKGSINRSQEQNSTQKYF